MCWVQPAAALHYSHQALAYAEEHEVYSLSPVYGFNIAWLQLRAGEWEEAERSARTEIDGGSTVVDLLGKTVRTELAVRRGDPDASELLADVTAQADRLGEVHRIGPVLELLAEWALTTGAPMPTERFETILAQVRRASGLVGCQVSRIAAWAAVAGIDVELDQPMPAPHAAMVRRDWLGSANAFAEVGWNYDRALMLSLLDEEEPLAEALAIARRHGAGPLTGRVSGRMRELGFRIPPDRGGRSGEGASGHRGSRG
jgi:hypothetical protein